MRIKKVLYSLTAVLLSLCMVLPAFAADSVPPFPTATVTEVTPPAKGVPVYGADHQPTGRTADIDAEFQFKADDPTEAQKTYYGKWICDYRVTFSDNLAAGSFGLYGKYGDYNVAFDYPVDTGTEPVYLLRSVGLDNHLTFNEVLNLVDPFNCGVYNLSVWNAGKTMTVELVMWSPDDAELKNVHVVATKSYTFPEIPFPTATVTEVTPPAKGVPVYGVDQNPTGRTADIDAEFRFKADDPTEKQIAFYGKWICDYRVTFSDNLAAGSFGLYGKYGDYNVAFDYPVDTGTEPVYLLRSVGLDNHLTFNEVLNLVDPFNCGVYNLSVWNAGKTMTVELVMWSPDDAELKNVHVVATKSYTFPEIPLPEATVTPVPEKDLPEAATIYEAPSQPTDETTAVDAAYVFAAVTPTEKQKAFYGDWICDYRITFDSVLAAESFGLYGNYGNYGDVAFLYPTEGNTTPVYLLSLLGLDSHLTYNEVLTLVDPFTCGVFNRSAANAGKTMKVELIMRAPGGSPEDAAVLASTSYTFPANLTVELTSQDTEGNSGVAMISGGGEFLKGDEVTVTAPEVTGYKFLGWYENEYTGEPVSNELKYIFVITASRKLIAVYESEGTVGDLHIIGSKYTVDNGIEQQSNADFDIKVGKKVELEYTGTDFLYWVNISDNIISTSEKYTFTFVGETTIRLITTRNFETEASVYVVFLNAYKQVLSEGRAIDEEGVEDLFPKTNPSKMGVTFVKWVFEGTEDEATADAIFEKASKDENSVVKIVPLYDKTEDTYKLTVKYVNGGSAQDVEGYVELKIPAGEKKTINVSDIAEATGADAAAFSFWSYDGEMPISTNESCSVVALKDQKVVLYAVFGVPTEDMKPAIIITQMSAAPSGEKFKIMTTTRWFAPEGYTVQEVGFVYSANAMFANDPDALLIGAENSVKHISPMTDATGIYTFNGTTSVSSRTLYIKGFLTYTDSDGNVLTIYTDMWHGSYDSLTGN